MIVILSAESLFNNPQERQQVDEQIAVMMSGEIARMFRRQIRPPKRLSERAFSESHDPSLPTVAIDAIHQFSGSQLLGVAAARRRQNRKIGVNIIHTLTINAGYKMTDQGLIINHGFFINGDGEVSYGKTPEPVKVDAVESADYELLCLMKNVGIPTLSDPDIIQRISDKNKLGELGDIVGIRVPERFSIDALTAVSDIVIKPSQESQGRGVFFSSRYPGNPSQWKEYYDFLEQHNYRPIIEERVRPWPIFDPETGEQLDWNVRALVGRGGQPIDMYVRAAPIDRAVNKSAGAYTIPINKLAEYTLDDGSAPVLLRALHNAAKDYGQYMSEFLSGIDLTVSEAGEVVLYESNTGHIGGLQTITRLGGQSYATRLKNANSLLDLMSRSVGHFTPPATTASEMVVAPTDEARLDFLELTGKLFGQDRINEEDFSNASRLGVLRALVSNINNMYFKPDDKHDSLRDQALQRLFDQFPLEIPAYAASRMAGATAALRDIVSQWLNVDPLSDSWNILSGKIAVQEGDLTEIKRVHSILMRSGHQLEAEALIHLTAESVVQEVGYRYGPASADITDMTTVIADIVSAAVNANTVSATFLMDIIEEMEMPDNSAYLTAGLAVAGVLLDDYGFADKQLSSLYELDDEQADDFILSFLSDKISRLMSSIEGAKLLVKYAVTCDLTASVLNALINTENEISQTASIIAIDEISQIYATGYSDDDRNYFTTILCSRLRGEPIVAEQAADGDTSLRLLAKLYALPRDKENRRYAETLARAIRGLDPRFSQDADLLVDDLSAD